MKKITLFFLSYVFTISLFAQAPAPTPAPADTTSKPVEAPVSTPIEMPAIPSPPVPAPVPSPSSIPDTVPSPDTSAFMQRYMIEYVLAGAQYIPAIFQPTNDFMIAEDPSKTKLIFSSTSLACLYRKKLVESFL